MVKKSRIIQTVVNMILIQSTQFIGSLKYCDWFDLYWRYSQAIRTLFTMKKITRSNNFTMLDASGISSNDESVNAKSVINSMLFNNMKKELKIIHFSTAFHWSLIKYWMNGVKNICSFYSLQLIEEFLSFLLIHSTN